MEVPLLVTDFLDRAVRLYPEKTAIVDGDHRWMLRDGYGGALCDAPPDLSQDAELDPQYDFVHVLSEARAFRVWWTVDAAANELFAALVGLQRQVLPRWIRW